MIREERVQTSFGEAPIRVVSCDYCGTTRLQDDAYYHNPGWFRVEKRKDDVPKVNEKFDMCSVDCLVRWVCPDLYHTDPLVVSAAIERLKATEQDLSSR